MKFLYPQFLWALGVLVIPVLIHLFNFRKYTTVYFSNIRFLQNVIRQSKAINRLKQLLIMSMRMLALAMLVIAFANPYIPASEEMDEASSYVSIYIDNSPSMESGEGNASHLIQARTKAADLVKALPDHFKIQIISNQLEGREMRFYSAPEALTLIDELELSYASRKASEISRRIEDVQVENNIQNLEIFWISDFQKSHFTERIDFPNSWKTTALPLSPPENAYNISIDSVWFDQPILQLGFEQPLSIKISCSGENVDVSVPLSLSINGELQSSREINIESGKDLITSFTINTNSKGTFQGLISADAGNPTFDNQFYFTYTVARPFEILLLGGQDLTGNLNRLYLDSIYNLNQKKVDEIDYSRIQEHDLFIVEGVDELPGALIEGIRTNVLMGKNLVLIPESNSKEAINNLLRSCNLPVLGVEQGSSMGLEINWEDPHFKNVFTEKPDNPVLPSTKSNYTYPANAGFPLITLENGSPLVCRIPYGEGQIILFTSSAKQTNIQAQAIFVPLMLNAALFSRPASPLYTIAGKSVGPRFNLTEHSETPLSLLLNDDFNLIPRQRTKGNEVELYDLPSSIAPDVYPVYQGEEQIGKVAINISPSESQWDFLNEPEIMDYFDLKQENIIAADTGLIDNIIEGRYQGTPLWKIFILGALLFLLVEIALIKLWK